MAARNLILGGELATLMSRDDPIFEETPAHMRDSLNSVIKLMGNN
ncbi:hypothetical protein [Methanosarcina barkeri]|nr:hypothetical protein [Methanosarcina barkeri]